MAIHVAFSKRWRNHLWFVPGLLYTVIADQVDFKLTPRNVPCTYLPDNPTWSDLVDMLNAVDFAFLCPFTITGSACPTALEESNRIITVERSGQSLICDLTSTTDAECVIDCPLVQFVVKGDFTVESIKFRNYLEPVIVVEGSFTSKASSFENGAAGAIRGSVSSSISIIQGSVISGNQLNNNQYGAGVATNGRLEIDGSTFSNNQNNGQSGGAVFVGEQSNFIITGSTFRGNVAVFGPAIYSDADRTQSEFSNNRACNNVATWSQDASCQGIVFLQASECAAFGKGCIPDSTCSFITCIVQQIVNLIIARIFEIISINGGGVGDES